MNQWKIIKVEQDGKGHAEDLNTYYNLEAQLESGTGGIPSVCLKYCEIKELLDFNNFDDPRDLIGCTYASPGRYEDFGSVMNYNLLMMRTDNTYIPPSFEQLYERAVCALSRMTCPNFSDIDDLTVFNAFFHAYNNDWLGIMMQRVHQRSGGQVRVQIVNPKARGGFPMIQGQAVYMMLFGPGDRRIRFTFTPSAEPFEFYE